MATIDPDYMTLKYSCQYRGVPSRDHDPGDFPMDWEVSIDGLAWDEGEEDNDGRDVHVGDARFSIVPDAGMIDLFMTLDAVDQEMANVAEMLTVERPDLMPNAGMDLGGDLLIMSSLLGRSAIPRAQDRPRHPQSNPGNRRQKHLPGRAAGRPGPHR